MLESFYIDVKYDLDWVDWTNPVEVENSYHIIRARFLEEVEKIGDIDILLKQHPYSTIDAVLEDTALSIKESYIQILGIITEYQRRTSQWK